MDKETIYKKIDQIKNLLKELDKTLSLPFDKFIKDLNIIRASERNFQLMVDIAIDINSQIIIEKDAASPDTYKQSFLELGNLKILPRDLSESLAKTASLRNILVHEYDFEEDYRKFYDSAKNSIESYQNYCRIIYKFLEEV